MPHTQPLRPQRHPAEVPGHLTSAKNLGRESLQEARRSVWGLLPGALEHRPLEGALEDEVGRFGAAGQEEASFHLQGDRVDLSPTAQAALLRICQEALTNVKRHAKAKEVSVTLAYRPESVSLTIQDNGSGFDPGTAKEAGGQGGFGLEGMEQRARLLEGTFVVNSNIGEGTTIEVTIPAA